MTKKIIMVLFILLSTNNSKATQIKDDFNKLSQAEINKYLFRVNTEIENGKNISDSIELLIALNNNLINLIDKINTEVKSTKENQDQDNQENIRFLKNVEL